VNAGLVVLEVPDLGDERLRLRPWRLADAPALVRAWHDPDIIEGSRPPADRSPEAASRWIGGCDERRRLGVALDLVIADPADDRVLGEVGLSKLDPGRRAAVIGWWVHADERGRGVATDAITLFTQWALGPAGLRALFAEIATDNPASLRVAERAGYRQVENPRNPQETARGRAPRVWYVAVSTVK
jgi:RimJ/RimL family protein N-acetyltransferase